MPGARVWWDSTQGSFCSDGFIGGLGQYPTVDSIVSAAGLTLTADERAELQLQFDHRPADDAYSMAARISKADFMERFTDAELVTIYATAKQSIPVEVWLDRFRVAEFVNLADPRTAGGVRSLELVGILEPGRADQILKVGQ